MIMLIVIRLLIRVVERGLMVAVVVVGEVVTNQLQQVPNQVAAVEVVTVAVAQEHQGRLGHLVGLYLRGQLLLILCSAFPSYVRGIVWKNV
jgi:hypothetical protein